MRWSVPANRQALVRGGLGVLLAANLIAAVLAFYPPGGSLEQLESELVTARQQLAARSQLAARLKKNVDKVVLARTESDKFMAAYFVPRKTAYSLVETSMLEYAKASGVQVKDRTYSYEAVEGSEELGVLLINANFEGTYADLVEMVNRIDRSERLVILDSLQAQPTQGSATLAINLRLYTFFREEGAL